MTPEVLRTFFRSGMFVAALALILVFTVPRDSAEFVVSVCSLGLGITLLTMVTAVHWFTRR